MFEERVSGIIKLFDNEFQVGTAVLLGSYIAIACEHQVQSKHLQPEYSVSGDRISHRIPVAEYIVSPPNICNDLIILILAHAHRAQPIMVTTETSSVLCGTAYGYPDCNLGRYTMFHVVFQGAQQDHKRACYRLPTRSIYSTGGLSGGGVLTKEHKLIAMHQENVALPDHPRTIYGFGASSHAIMNALTDARVTV